MKYSVFGTGMVGNTIATKLISQGHEVMMGSRTKDNEKAKTWLEANSKNGSIGTFAEAAAFSDIIFNCTLGSGSMQALKSAGNLSGKILIDVSNPLDFSKGMPPSLLPEYSNTTSLAEEIQKVFPEMKVVKTLNTMNCYLMVDSSKIPGKHDVFICGDEKAKTTVKEILKTFGWISPIDLGDLSGARGTEMMLPVWVRLYGTFQSPMFNFNIVKG
jgi:predicted dinucleotide-binding enzyme